MLDAAQQIIFDTEQRNLAMAQKGLFGASSATVAARALAAINNLMKPEGWQTIYVGTDSVYDKAIRWDRSQRTSDPVTSTLDNGLTTSIMPLSAPAPNTTIGVDTSADIFPSIEGADITKIATVAVGLIVLNMVVGIFRRS